MRARRGSRTRSNGSPTGHCTATADGYGRPVTYYWISVGLVLLGIVLLVLVASRAYRAVRMLNTVRGAVQTVVHSEVGLLKARKAALGVAFQRRGIPGRRWSTHIPRGLRDTMSPGRRLVHEHEGRP